MVWQAHAIGGADDDAFVLQGLKDLSAVPADIDQHKVAFAGDILQAHLLELGVEVIPALRI